MADVINIDRFIEAKGGVRPKNRIHKVGVEVEGLWYPAPGKGSNFHRDGSVTFDPLAYRQFPVPDNVKVGEACSDPIVPAKMPWWINRFYPTKTNETCGLHVHMSFESVKWYSVLMDSASYQDTMVEYLTQWAKEQSLPDTHLIWNRLGGENRFCQNKFWPEQQIVQTTHNYSMDHPGHRYTVINYCFNLKGRGTLECRVLPAFEQKDLAISALQRVFDVTNGCLCALSHKEGHEHVTLSLPANVRYEEYFEEVLS